MLTLTHLRNQCGTNFTTPLPLLSLLGPNHNYYILLMGLGVTAVIIYSYVLFLKMLQRSFAYHVDGCPFTYSRKDHLNRHLLTHQGKLFACPIEGCNRKFSVKGNVQRHVEEIHKDGSLCEKKEFTCLEANCGKTFKYASRLKKHEESHGEKLTGIHFHVSNFY
jgi:hypothetical protein